jgi:hypothetical protein
MSINSLDKPIAEATKVDDNSIPIAEATKVDDNSIPIDVATADTTPSNERLKEVYNIICGNLVGNLVGDDIRDVMNELAKRGLVNRLQHELRRKNKVVMMEHKNNTDLSLVVDTSKLSLDSLQDNDYWEVVPDKTFSGGRQSKKQRNSKKLHKSKKQRNSKKLHKSKKQRK